MEIGDIVLLIDPNVSRGRWQLGKVIKVYPGSDGKVRSVSVKTAESIYQRPITKLSMLISKEEYGNESEEILSSRGESV